MEVLSKVVFTHLGKCMGRQQAAGSTSDSVSVAQLWCRSVGQG
jgi:hypothetical protein